jgi:hypothetical protein
MENVKPDSVPIEGIEQELMSSFTPDYRGLPLRTAYRAAQLFEKVNAEFKAAPGKVIVLGVSTFKDWMAKFQQNLKVLRLKGKLDPRRTISIRQIHKYVQVGRYLIPQTQMTESEFETLGGFEKAVILADVAEAGRLTQDLLKASADYTVHKLEEVVAPLLGKKVQWEKRLTIDSHEAAEASLIVMGNRLGYKTYTAHPAHKFGGQELAEISTQPKLPHFATEQTMRSASRIDVVWLKEDYPEYFFEVENTTNITSGLHRMYQARKYGEQFFIVGPKEFGERFRRELEKAPFKAVEQKYLFRTYVQLLNMFRAASRYCDAQADFFGKQSSASEAFLNDL